MSVGNVLTSPIFGGILALVATSAAVIALIRPKPRLRVTARFFDPGFRNVVLTAPVGQTDQHPICIEVTNTGRRAVTVREVGFAVKPPLDTPVGVVSVIQISDSQLPVCLEPGQTHITYGPPTKLP